MSTPDRNAAFVGDVPGNYDRYLRTVFFQSYADDLAARLPVKPDMCVLETACGTGIVTRSLLDRMRGHGRLVATDLNEAMIDHGRRHVKAEPGLIEWQTADATKLPFPDGSFDAVVCQFGLMFFPDKAAGIREAFRVLKPGGHYLFNVWDQMARNPIARITHETAASFFPSDPPMFYTVPFSLHDLEKTGTSPSAADAATGLIDGNPIGGQIMERRPEALGEVKRAVAARIAAELGDSPVRAPLRALVFTARRP
jgi:ubiquinone/menaquinone biosynthesis C-methylase UbiE